MTRNGDLSDLSLVISTLLVLMMVVGGMV